MNGRTAIDVRNFCYSNRNTIVPFQKVTRSCVLFCFIFFDVTFFFVFARLDCAAESATCGGDENNFVHVQMYLIDEQRVGDVEDAPIELRVCFLPNRHVSFYVQNGNFQFDARIGDS